MKHWRLQNWLADLLRPLAGPSYVVGIELAFRALPEHELRAADVAVISRTRFDATDEDDNIRGAPEIVIEILSQSNTTAEMQEREELCLANGAEEFGSLIRKRK